jgi:hypothetical protein
MALGVVFLIRPFNIIIVLIIPFLAGNWDDLKTGFKTFFEHQKILLISVLTFVLIASVQPIIYFIQTNHIWIDSYPGEHFNLLKPHLLQILFSFQKGLFVYTPMVLLAQFSLVYLFRNNKFMAYSYLTFFGVLTYLLSSWWIWYYGGSFSLRAYIEYFGIFAILLTILFNEAKLFKLKTFLVLFFIVLCQIQTYQYRYFIIHWSEMDQDKYFGALKNIFGV